MVDGLWWDDANAAYIRARSERYPGATNIEPSWTLEAAVDPRRIVRDPDPKSRIGAIRAYRVLADRWIRSHRDHRLSR